MVRAREQADANADQRNGGDDPRFQHRRIFHRLTNSGEPPLHELALHLLLSSGRITSAPLLRPGQNKSVPRDALHALLGDYHRVLHRDRGVLGHERIRVGVIRDLWASVAVGDVGHGRDAEAAPAADVVGRAARAVAAESVNRVQYLSAGELGSR